jgi:hypothetical protein
MAIGTLNLYNFNEYLNITTYFIRYILDYNNILNCLIVNYKYILLIMCMKYILNLYGICGQASSEIRASVRGKYFEGHLVKFLDRCKARQQRYMQTFTLCPS